MKCDVKCYDYAHHSGGPWTAVYNNVRALVTFFLVYISIDWWHKMPVLIGKKSFICSRTVKLNGQSVMFGCMLAMGCHWWCTHKYIFIDVQ